MAVKIHSNAHVISDALNYELEVVRYGFGKRKMEQFYNEAFVTLEESFGQYVDTQAVALPKTLHHVYEWNQIGSNRLWFLKKSNLQNGFRVNFGFKQSRVKSPIDPILLTPGKNGRVVKKSRVFYNKAMVMESGIGVTMHSKGKSRMAYPTSRTKSGIGFTRGPLYVANPGGKQTTFGFQRAMARYFGTGLATRHLKASGVMDRPAKRVTRAGNSIPASITRASFKGSMGRNAIEAAARAAVERA